ncbi:YczE/YyaS/YitT family protein [Liquorilactobacillus sicerae]|uniref:YczE/YyaS/YitT family protein n=1 Tax=Liquorilactobacillus sicerae TaxID=1416943 RepID=UPI00248022A6|nr:hypothetical protein [Liquorilactobacillus sicerae]
MQNSPTGYIIHNKSGLTIFYFFISIILNSLGNALTVTLNLGSALWTAAAVNLAHATPLSLTWLLLLEGFFAIGLNILFLQQFDGRRILGNLIFMFCFAYLVGVLSKLFSQIPLVNLNLGVRIILDCFGIVLIAIAISIYQRVNVILHPCDDLMQVIRFKFCHGNSTQAQLLSFSFPAVAILLAFAITKQLYAINIGTVFSLLFQGYLVGQADKHIFSSLKHQNLKL